MKISGPISLIKKACRIYFKKTNLLYFSKIAFVNAVIVMASGFAFGFLNIYNDTGALNLEIFKQANHFLTIARILYVITIFVWGMWFNIAQIHASSNVVSGTAGNLRSLLGSSWKKLWKYFLAVSLVLLIVLGGLILLIIPGIIFSVWFVFVSFVISLEDTGIKSALIGSKKLIKGKAGAVLGRMLIFGLLMIIVQFIFTPVPYVGPFMFLIISPFFTLLGYLLYLEVKALPQLPE